MQDTKLEQPLIDFYMYPPIGDDDWRYLYQTALVRMYEMQMLTRATLLDMANAESLEAAASFLTATEYALPQAGRDFAEMQDVLRIRRQAIRQLFADLMLDKSIVRLFRTRDDFANIRLALRRTLTGKPIGAGYSNDGNLPPEWLEEVFEQENYKLLPDFLQAAIDQVVLAYYQNKDIRQIDYAVDNVQAEYNLKRARQLRSIFLLGLFRIQIDLTNIRTMLRLKFTESEQGPRLAGTERNVFLSGGYIDLERLQHGL